MPRSTKPSRSDLERLRDLPTWTNVLLTDDTPIRWTTEPGTPPPGDELTGRLVIGEEEQLVIDLCGTAATNLLAILAAVHHAANVPPPPSLCVHDLPETPDA